MIRSQANNNNNSSHTRKLPKRMRVVALFGLCLTLCLGCVACSGDNQQTANTSGNETSSVASGEVSGQQASSSDAAAAQRAAEAPIIDGLTYQSSMDLYYANQFSVHYYNDGYKVLDIVDDAQYLVVPEGADVPANIPADMVLIQQPVNHIYLAATASASLFNAIGGLDAVSMTGTDADGWSVDAMRQAVESGDIRYVGKYSAPDYETMVENNCDLALESTMILHSPDVKEALEDLGIPVMIERSSYESEPMGRVEWCRFFGALLNKEDQADAFFDDQRALVQDMQAYDPTGKTVAFFSVNSNGQVVVRRPGDFITRCIEIAGGTYALDGLDDSGKLSTMKISLEEFYATASDADYLVYNGTIEAPLSSVDDLINKNQTFADYAAVKAGNLYTTNKDMYQSTDKLAELIQDFHTLVTDGDASSMTFLKKVE